jgi:hypothetical protein
MKQYNQVICFCCDAVMENMHYPSINKKSYVYVHPTGGLHFQTYGHYGSTVFDPVDGASIDIAICDACVSKRITKIYGTGNI